MWQRFALVLLLLLAGCSAPSGLDTGPSSPTPTLSPAPTVSNDLPEGLSATGVTAAATLAAAHRTALGNRSFTVRTRFQVVDADGFIFGETTTIRVGPAGRVAANRSTEWRDRSPVQSAVPRLDVYYANGTTFTRAVDDRVSYARVQETEGPDDLRQERRLRELYVAGRHWSVRETRVDGERAYALETTDVALTALRPSPFVRQPRDVRLQVTMTAAGRLISWRLSYVVTFEDGPAQVTRGARLFAVGTTTVTTPPWLAEAKNATA